MSSILIGAFRRCCDAKRRVTGGDSVNINGQDYEDTLVDVITADQVFLAGGKGEAGGFRCQVLICDLQKAPQKFDPIIVRGSPLQILSIDDVNGISYTITAGDPLTQT